MNRITFTALGASLVVALAGACSSGSDEHAPTIAAGGTSTAGAAGARSSRAGSGGRASDGKAGSNEAAEQGGTSGEAGQGGAAGLEQGTVVDVPDSTCSPTAHWSSPKELAGVSGDGVDRLLSITADELDAVFLRDSKLFRTHRDKASADFGTPSEITVPAEYDATEGAALSADGKTLLLVATGGHGFAILTRTSRTLAFSSSADSDAFFALNARAVQTMEHYTSPVLSADGNSLIYTGFTPEPTQGFPVGVEGVARVYESLWASDAWQMPTSISDELFDGTTAARPLPSGLSKDSRTLFYFDEKTSKQAARFRDRGEPSAPFNVQIDLGDRPGAIPNAACDALYYTEDGKVLRETN